MRTISSNETVRWSGCLQFLQNVSLKSKTTLQLPAYAAWYCEAASVEHVVEAVAFARQKKLPILVLGGGSNLVLASDLECLVLANDIQGSDITNHQVVLGAGENWHEFVSRASAGGVHGFENLALIPGNAGAAPMQNIGAYGLELEDRFVSLEAVHLDTGEQVHFSRDDCQFGYRDSLFKRERSWCITSIRLEPSTEYRADYPGIQAYMEQHHLEVTHASIFQAVCELRKSKLPDVRSHPNAGSFFKNPVIAKGKADVLGQMFPGMPAYSDKEGIKMSAAWLIDKAGLKGRRTGGFSVSEKHALVVVNEGDGDYLALNQLIEEIKNRVEELFGVVLEVEPTIYPE